MEQFSEYFGCGFVFSYLVIFFQLEKKLENVKFDVDFFYFQF